MLLKNLLPGVSVAGLVAASPYPTVAKTPVQSATIVDRSADPSPILTAPVGPSQNSPHGQIRGVWTPGETPSSRRARIRAICGYVENGYIAVSSINDSDGAGQGRDSYEQYTGDGSVSAGWPSSNQWVSFEEMFTNNKALMFSSCSQFNQAENSGSEVDAIYDAIESVATATQVDHRFILAVIMQESGGCVRVPTTNWGVRNPGLLQDHNGAGSCNDNGQVQTPCPAIVVHQMVSEGTAGTADGDGLAQCINESGAGDVSAFYKAARIYNSGSVDPSGDLNKGISTYCYASDIANRLTGWVMAPYGCYLDGA
ncbi:MAG: hypothetical protein FRX48_04115 [Lasallia pustulata]|uniref:Glycoside hydrolase n=1 Tax=Lasallia pustulata TaxID=136370 RepID=A0A5M8PSE5_9LECA|nr:MAG: hypothetical protein FRX48_04115 [Lasallia pustulata]